MVNVTEKKKKVNVTEKMQKFQTRENILEGSSDHESMPQTQVQTRTSYGTNQNSKGRLIGIFAPLTSPLFMSLIEVSGSGYGGLKVFLQPSGSVRLGGLF